MFSDYDLVTQSVFGRVSLAPLQGKRVLLLGSNGLIGSHLLAVIHAANQTQSLRCKVTAISRNPLVPWLSDILDSGFEFHELDLSQNKLPYDWQHDYIIHAAGYGQPMKFLKSPLDTMRINARVTEDLLEMCRRHGSSLLFLSSTEIYGDSSEIPVQEENLGRVSPSKERAPYTSSKQYGETLCSVYSREFHVRTKVARVGATYGPGTRIEDARVLTQFIRSALETGEIRPLDYGRQRRRWLYISDAVVMLFHVLLHGQHSVYNVAGNDLKSIHELAVIIGEETGAKVIFPKGTEIHALGALGASNIDNARIIQELGTTSLVTLREGIRPCIRWVKTQLSSLEMPTRREASCFQA